MCGVSKGVSQVGEPPPADKRLGQFLNGEDCEHDRGIGSLVFDEQPRVVSKSLGVGQNLAECALIDDCRNAVGFVHVLLFRVMAAPYRVRDETAPAIINAPIRIAILTGSFDAPTTSRSAITHKTTHPELQRKSITPTNLNTPH